MLFAYRFLGILSFVAIGLSSPIERATAPADVVLTTIPRFGEAVANYKKAIKNFPSQGSSVSQLQVCFRVSNSPLRYIYSNYFPGSQRYQRSWQEDRGCTWARR